MKNRLTKSKYEEYLNSYFDELPLDTIFKSFAFMAKRNIILNAYNKKKLGSLFRKKDPIAFEVNYNEKLNSLNF
jgi:hypothetical protein